MIGQTLAKAGLPCQRVDRQTIMEHSGIQSLVGALKIILGMGMFNDIPALEGFFKPPLSAKGLNTIKAWAYRNDLTLARTFAQARRLPIPHLGRKQQQRLFDYTNTLADWRRKLAGLTLVEGLAWIAGAEGLQETFRDDPDWDCGYRQMLSLAASYDSDVAGFLANLNLAKHTDMYDRRVEKVALMTMHAAKGLEFAVVFIAGCEEGWIPYRSTHRPADVEEERRLFYVAMTRAKQHLYLTKAGRRRISGQMEPRTWSPFVKEIENSYNRFSGQKGTKSAVPTQEQLSLF